MRALVWIVEDTWAATVAEAAAFLPDDSDVTLLHVASTEPEAVARGARHGLLGRRPPPPAAHEPLRAISDQAAQELLAEAETRLGRPARREARRGRIEREVIAAAETMDILVLARDGDRERLGPHSLGPAARFVVDHAPCRVLLIWPDVAPAMETIPPAPPPGARP
ncbi:MAG TPA: universal stress protein [Thermoleophilaceae bacterium]|jgi:nucleotide-binding universal stress UspA family protein|nr:universal stress protein [Thermoleophilaceae bacterium]